MILLPRLNYCIFLENLALHCAIQHRQRSLNTVKLLLDQSSDPYVENKFGDGAIQTAGLRGDSVILSYLIKHVKPTVVRQIEAFELMGAHFVDEGDFQAAISTWKNALHMRYQDPENIIRKKVNTKSNPAYMGVKEATTMEELDAAATNPDVVYMQALLTRERILGPYHIDTVNGLIHRAQEYTYSVFPPRCQLSLDLCKYAFQLLSNLDELPDYRDILDTFDFICCLFTDIYYVTYTAENVCFLEVCNILDMAVVFIVKKEDESADGDRVYIKVSNAMLWSILVMIDLLLMLITETGQRRRLCKTVYKLIQSRVTGNNGKQLLHIAAQMEFIYVIELLIDCGCDVNGMDNDRNTALHVCAEEWNQPIGYNREPLPKIVLLLLERGAHFDCVNNLGVNVGKMLEKHTPSVCAADYISLKCLAASVIKKYGIKYEGKVPVMLVPFINMH